MVTRIPAPETRELPDDEAWRALWDEFHLFDEQATEPAPLALEPLPDEPFLAQVRRILGDGHEHADGFSAELVRGRRAAAR